MTELSWRKFPVNTIRNENLDYIAFMLPAELKSAPFMFYMTAVCTCDDDGVFDLEDGVIFSRLMRVGSPGDVLKIAYYMVTRRIITQVIPGSNIFMITDWEAPERRGVTRAKTAEERRAYVAQRIDAERRAKAPEYQAPLQSFNDYPFPSEPQPTGWTEPAKSEPDPFFCGLNDKNAKNVAQTEREREKETKTDTEEREFKESREKTHTHTETTEPPTPLESVSGSVAEESKAEDTNTETQNTESLAEEALTAGSNTTVEAGGTVSEEEKSKLCASEDMELVEAINTFFVRNSLLFSPEYDSHKVMEIIRRVKLLETPKNPAKIIIQTVLRQFKIRSETKNDYFYKCNLTPQFLLSANTWAHMLQDASALLLRNNEDKTAWLDQMDKEKDLEQVEAISNDVEAQCIQYGIDPKDPQRLSKLLAKTAAGPGKNTDTG